MMPVAKVALHGGIDVLIGMDILGLGDFTVTHYGGNTTFSFCCPSRKEIDLVSEVNGMIQPHLPATMARVGRNEPCPCGSNKKYKKCHGR